MKGAGDWRWAQKSRRLDTLARLITCHRCAGTGTVCNACDDGPSRCECDEGSTSTRACEVCEGKGKVLPIEAKIGRKLGPHDVRKDRIRANRLNTKIRKEADRADQA